jgi:hypothetical protein
MMFSYSNLKECVNLRSLDTSCKWRLAEEQLVLYKLGHPTSTFPKFNDVYSCRVEMGASVHWDFDNFAICGGLKNSPVKDIHIKYLEPGDVILHGKRGDGVRDLQKRSPSWIMWTGPKCNCMPRDTQEMIQRWSRETWHKLKNASSQPPGAGRGKEWILPSRLQKERSPA